MTTEAKRGAELARRPYAFTLVQGDDGIWTVTVLEFPGVIAEGDSPDEAIADGREALAEMIDYYLDEGRTIAEPFATREFSGRTELRLPPELHRRAVMMAANEGISLNRWLSAAAATYAGSVASAPPVVQQRPRLVAEDQATYEEPRPSEESGPDA